MISKLFKFIGTIPAKEHGYKARTRFHQGWWRTFVLGETEGHNPAQASENVCNTILHGESSKKNFLTSNTIKAIADTLKERKEGYGAGMVDERRLYGNLLSSQPLSFNFFGELHQDANFAGQVLKAFYPEVESVERIIFEYAPRENFNRDNSAFDVAFMVKTQSKRGLIAFECKYVNEFSPVADDRREYRTLFQNSSFFLKRYEDYRVKKFDQLFRNQLIAEGLLQNKKYDFVWTGLFCNQEDEKTMSIGQEFQRMLKDGQKTFKILTYSEYLSAIQKLELTWEQREWSMLLWTRYSGLGLSQALYEGLKKAN